MTPEETILTTILARGDAIFAPIREADQTGPGSRNIHAAKVRFAKSGIAWQMPGGAAVRKQNQRILDGLADAGMLELYGAPKRDGARLTQAGDAYTRGLAGLPGLVEAHAKLRAVIRQAVTWNGLELCSELWPVRKRNYSVKECWPACLDLALELAPAMARGWVETNSDLFGRAFYLPTEAGREAAKLPAPVPPKDLPDYDEEAGETYFNEKREARRILQTAKPNPAEAGPCRLPCSLDLGRAPYGTASDEI